MKSKRLCFFVTLVAVMIPFFGGTELVSAEGKPDYQIGISPFQNNLNTMAPGETYEGEFVVKNTGKEEFDFDLTFSPYNVESETYNPDYSKNTKYNDIIDWITLDIDKGLLREDEEQKIHYVVSVPVDAHGGAQLGAILVTMRADDTSVASDQNAIQTVRQLGYVLFGNVDGDVVETGKVLENKVPSFLFNPPIYGTSVVENTGNVYTAAQYTLQVFPLFSDEEVYTNEEKPEDSIIFPETKRFNQISWEGAPHLGIFKVRQTVKIFDEESVTEKIVFLCPIWFLFIVLLLIFCIIFWLVSRAFRRKKEA